MLSVIALALFTLASSLAVSNGQFNRDYVGVCFSPYTKGWNNGEVPWFNSYTMEDVKAQLNVISTKFTSISTYGVGLNQWNQNNQWDSLDANSIVAKAAAELNRDAGRKRFIVNQGIYQHDDKHFQDKEVNFAFKIAEECNKIYAGTVWGLTFTNEFIVNVATGQKVLGMMRHDKIRAQGLGLKIGARSHACGHILNTESELYSTFADIARVSDFISCNMYPTSDSVGSVDIGVTSVTNFYNALKVAFKGINGNLDVQIGETGWPSQGINFNGSQNSVQRLKDYWLKMASWAAQNMVKVQMFEAINEPWKCNMKLRDFQAFNGPNGGECHFGWWYRQGDSYHEK